MGNLPRREFYFPTLGFQPMGILVENIDKETTPVLPIPLCISPSTFQVHLHFRSRSSKATNKTPLLDLPSYSPHPLASMTAISCLTLALRWSFEPEIGLSHALGNWTLEGSAAVTLYTDNDDFDNGKTREQEPIYNLQGHVIYSFRRGIWLAIGATYFTGGRTKIDGVVKNDLQQNWRTGFTSTLPINRNHSVKLFGSSGVSTRTGSDYDSLGIAWQYAWGKGF